METDNAPRVLLRQGGEIDIPISDDPSEVRRVRRAVADSLASVGVAPVCVQDALVATSELVSNALVHGGRPRTVRLRMVERGLVIEVFDGSVSPPHVVRSARTEPGGRGLQLVSQLAAEWGTHLRPDGKWVWCVLALER